MAEKANKWSDGDSAQDLSAPHPALRPLGLPRWRARPDGTQRWLRLPFAPDSAALLRHRATQAGVTVDAWLGIALAYACVADRRRDLEGALLGAVDQDPLRFAPTSPLRSWQHYLLSADGPSISDELPEVVLGAGLGEAEAEDLLGPALGLTRAQWELGRECELRAAAQQCPLPCYIDRMVR
jgi:hypothetical protein